MPTSANSIAGNSNGSTTPSQIEIQTKSLFDVPCIGDALSLLSIGLLQILQATFNLLKPSLEIYVQQLNLQSANLSIIKIGFSAELQLLDYTIQSAEKVISSLPTGVFKKCPALNGIYEKTLGFVRHTNISARANDLKYKLQQINSIQTEVELLKSETLLLVRQVDVLLDKINQRLEGLSV